jgi:hypothetical protein
MKKLITLIAVAIACIAGIAIGFSIWMGDKTETIPDALLAVPPDATFILKIDDYQHFSSGLRNNNSLWRTLGNFRGIQRADSIISFLNDLAIKYDVVNKLLTLNTLYISVHNTGGNQLGFHLVLKKPEGVEKGELISLARALAIGAYRIDDNKYDGVTIYRLYKKEREEEFVSFAATHGVVMCASSGLLLEASVRQLQARTSLLNNPSFVSVNKTAGSRVDANLYINHSKVPPAFARHLAGKYPGGINTLADIAQWTELDMSLKEDILFLNGFSICSDSANSYLRVLLHQKPVEVNVQKVIPAQTGLFINLGISDLDTYLQDYRNYLDRKGQLSGYTATLGRMMSERGVNPHELFRSFFDNELALALTPFDGSELDQCWFIVTKTRGASQALLQLTNAMENYIDGKDLGFNNGVITYKIDKDKAAKIYRSPFEGIHASLFGSLFEGVPDGYFTLIDDYLVFGASAESLSKFILANIHNRQMQMDVSYRSFSEVLSASANISIFVNPLRLEKFYGILLKPQFAAAILSRMDALAKIQGVAIQLKGGSNMVFNNVCVKYSPEVYEDPKTAWETQLDNPIACKPQIVVNHYSKNREIFVQDRQNTIYLINDAGRIIWKHRMDEAIMGGVTQVDLYRNEKLQLLFNTRSHLHCIDRNGKSIEGFPVKYRSAATNPVAVFDYEGNRDYRFMQACDDRRIYVFNPKGKPISGWDFNKTERIVRDQLQHFRVKGKDYIVFADANRMYILDRRGSERVRMRKYFPKARNAAIVLDDSHGLRTPQFVTTDTIGLIHRVSLDGLVEDVAIRPLSPNHFFDCQDVNADGSKDYIFLDDNVLYVYSQTKDPILNYSFGEEVQPLVLYFNFGGQDRKLGVLANTSSNVFLVNNSGSLYEGFPLSGNTPFSICQLTGSKSRFNLIVGSSNGMLLNYAVN